MSKVGDRFRNSGIFRSVSGAATERASDSGSRSSSSAAQPAPPPAYSATGNPADDGGGGGVAPAAEQDPDAEPINLAAAFEKLSLRNGPETWPSPDSCLAHLKLLFALQALKEDIGYTDGLWGLWDSLAGPIDLRVERSVEERAGDKQLQVLSQIREKRWAIFVARAVERYEAWWRTFGGAPLSEWDMMTATSDRYCHFPDNGRMPLLEWTEEMLPPLDVLMIWHTHMLNPRAFLEDAMLAGLRSFWLTGMPWSLVHNAITTDFEYRVSDDCKAQWVAKTGFSWDSADDPLVKAMKCPRCAVPIQIPWTTCGVAEDHKYAGDAPNLIGNGYGDGNLQFPCPNPSCHLVVCKEILSVAKFVADTCALLAPVGRPMPGTILNPQSGKPEAPPRTEEEAARVPRMFPNRLLKSGCNQIRTKVVEIITAPCYYRAQPTMQNIRAEIEKILQDRSMVREIDAVPSSSQARYRLHADARISVRKMMSRYWDNFSPFALDLCAAVMRQGIFVEKMYKLDWLHSPSARATMERLLTKYDRFVDIMAANPKHVAVPTLDVDLAWHTHQLSPSAYYHYAVLRTGRFVDHDDKIDEDTLSAHFEWTSKAYQDKYGEVYSECTCWYCEAIRTSVVNPVGKMLGISNQEKVAESFHTSGAAQLCPPSNSAHISAHNSVKALVDPSVRTSTGRLVQRSLAKIQQQRIDMAYAKAQKRAAKKGRTIPPRQEYYDHWGYPYVYYGAYMYPMWWTAGMYYGAYPGFVAACGGGHAGGCAAGSCGGGVAAGACGGPGGCGGGAAGGSCGGCGGGGGGSCGGGGDGGGGGGGCGGGGGGGGGGCGGG